MSETPTVNVRINACIIELDGDKQGRRFPVGLATVPTVGQLIHLHSYLDADEGIDPRHRYEVVQVLNYVENTQRFEAMLDLVWNGKPLGTDQGCISVFVKLSESPLFDPPPVMEPSAIPNPAPDVS